MCYIFINLLILAEYCGKIFYKISTDNSFGFQPAKKAAALKTVACLDQYDLSKANWRILYL